MKKKIVVKIRLTDNIIKVKSKNNLVKQRRNLNYTKRNTSQKEQSIVGENSEEYLEGLGKVKSPASLTVWGYQNYPPLQRNVIKACLIT